MSIKSMVYLKVYKKCGSINELKLVSWKRGETNFNVLIIDHAVKIVTLQTMFSEKKIMVDW